MSSAGPYSQAQNFTHMFNMVDFPSLIEKPYTGKNNSIYSFLCSNKKLTKFKYIVDVSRLSNILDDYNANFTLFCPEDEFIPDNIIDNITLNQAINIVKYSMLKNRITQELLTYTPFSKLKTLNFYNDLYIKSFDGKIYINNSDITIKIPDIKASNGIIHIIQGIILPEFLS